MSDPDLQREAFAERFGANLARQRRAAGLSQDALSYLAEVHRTEISQLERGLRIARVDTLVKLCAALDADPAELLGGIGWKPPAPDSGAFQFPAGDEQR